MPIKENLSNYFEIALNQIPQIILREGTDRIYANAILEASLFSSNLQIPIVADISFIPSYTPATGQISASQIKVENIDMNILAKEWLDVATEIVNKLLPTLFAKYVIYQLENKWVIKMARVVNLRTKVIDGRLEMIIL